MPEHGQLILALVVGLGFGFFVHRLGSSWQRLALMLVGVWALNPFAQELYAALRGSEGIVALMVRVAILWLVFGVGAVGLLAILNRQDRKGA